MHGYHGMGMCCVPPLSYVRFVWVWGVCLWRADNNNKQVFDFLLDLRFDKKTGKKNEKTSN